MAYVRVPHRVVPIRPLLPNHQVAPIRLPLSNYQAIPIRLPLSNPQAIPRIPIHHRPPMNVRKPVPQYVPVLQPPAFPREYNFYEEEEEVEEEEPYQEELFNYPTVVVADQHRTITHRTPTFMPLKNDTKQSLTQHNRHAKSKYPSNIYYKH